MPINAIYVKLFLYCAVVHNLLKFLSDITKHRICSLNPSDCQLPKSHLC